MKAADMKATGIKATGIKATDMTAGDMTAGDGVAGVIAALVRTQAGLDLPVRLRAWDGSEAGPADGPILVARSPRALRRILWRPGQLGLARAYISGYALVSLLVSAGHGQPARRYLLLAAYVTWRNHGKGEDPRYRDLLSRARGSRNAYAMRTVYLLQAAILWLACLPVQVGMLERAPAGAVTVIGAGVWLGGFAFEAVGDWQLARFKADPTNHGAIMDRGLWRYTRHPNYFGDFCMWWGLFLIALGSWAELPTMVGPMLMTFILTRGTGQRLTDQRMAATRPQYADYAARTSAFIPRPPRKSRSHPR
jgi:steroid 5-alpha reductase family enzyme